MLDLNYSSKPFYDIRKLSFIIITLVVIAGALTAYNVVTFIHYSGKSGELKPESEFLEKKQSELEAELAEGKKILDDQKNKNMLDRVEEINTLIRSRVFSWTQLLNLLEKSVPSKVLVKSISPKFEEDGLYIYIQIMAEDYNGIIKFIENLDRQKMFKDIRPVSEATDLKGGTRQINADFSLRYDPHTITGEEAADE